jgi:hypothetical protein
MPGGYLELSTVESNFWLESEGWSRSPPKSKREVAPQRDECWLKGNELADRPVPRSNSGEKVLEHSNDQFS